MFSKIYQVRYRLLNGDNLVKLRKTWFRWWTYEPFDNLLIAKQNKMNKLLAELEKTNDEYRELVREKQRAILSIREAVNCPEGYGPITTEKLPRFPRSKPRLPTPSDDWLQAGRFFNGGSSLADGFTIETGLKSAPSAGMSGYTHESAEEEVVAMKTHPIQPESKNQQKKNRGQNGQQQ